jgi:hypothetical protein
MYHDRNKVGLDVNRPIDPSTGEISATVADSRLPMWAGARWVRLNLILGPWASPADSTKYAGRTWFEAYDQIVDRYLERGLRIYALVGAEAVRNSAAEANAFRNPGDSTAADQWLQEYVANFGAIADHFQGRIHYYESFNEPNDWHRVPGGPAWSQAWIHPYWFARMLQEVYNEVRFRRSLDVTLVSGPLLTHDGDSGAQYLAETYTQGINTLEWQNIRYAHGRYPLDGIGFHLYVKQDCDATPESVSAAVATRVQALWDAAHVFEGETLEEKGLYVSEMGWQSVGCGQEFQARNLTAAFQTLIPDWRVRAAIWFCLQDFGPADTWGLYNSAGLGKENRKRAYDAFLALAPAETPQVITFEIPTVEQVLSSQGVSAAEVPNVLRLVQQQIGDPDTLVPGKYDVVLAERPQYTNQQMINAFWKAGGQTWSLLVKAGVSLDALAAARDAPYTGPAVDDLPNLTDEEKTLIKAALPTPPATAELDLWGKGMWMWQVAQCEAGKTQAIVQKAQSMDLDFVFLKIADGTDPYNGDVSALVKALRGAGVAVWGWQYTYGEKPADEAKYAAERMKKFELDGFVIDAEVEYEGHPDWAVAYMDALRSKLVGVPVGLSSFFLPEYHPSFPWREFLSGCDLNIPQVYWFKRDPVEALQTSLTQNIRFGRPILPTGAVYEMVAGQPPTGQDITRFLTEADNRGLSAVCFWSWQHCRTELWSAIQEYIW